MSQHYDVCTRMSSPRENYNAYVLALVCCKH